MLDKEEINSDLQGKIIRLTDLSLYDNAYGSRVKELIDGTKDGNYVSYTELLEKQDSKVSSLLSKRNKKRQKLNVSLEFGCWVYKIQSASRTKKKLIYQKRYLYLKDDVLYYSHSEFNPDVSTHHCKTIYLTAQMEYYTPSRVDDDRVRENKSVDLIVDDNIITFVSDKSFPNSSNFILTLCTTIKRMGDLLNQPQQQDELNRMFFETLDALGIPDTKWEEMAKQNNDKKWMLITQNRERMISGDVMVQSCVDFLKQGDLQISDIREIRTILGTSPKAFLEKFYNLGGFSEIQQIMYRIVMNKNRTNDDLLLLHEILPIVKSLLKTHDLLRLLLNVDSFVYTLVLCIFTKHNRVISDVFMFLGIICGRSDGVEQVLEAFDEVKIYAEEKVRFQSMLIVLSNVNDIDIVMNELVFFNTLLMNVESIAQRMAIYTDLLKLGYDLLEDTLVSRFPTLETEIANVYANFHSFLSSDRQAAILSGVDTSDVVNMILFIQEQAQNGSNWEYLCSLLRSLLVIPYDNLVGRTMWRQIVNTTNRVVTANMKENIDYLTNNDILDLINKKQILNEKYDAIKNTDISQDQLRRKVHKLELENEELKRVNEFSNLGNSDYVNRLLSDLISQISDVMTVHFMRNDRIYSKYFSLLESGMKLDDVIAICRKDGNDEQVVKGPVVTVTIKDEFISKMTEEIKKTLPVQTAPASAGAGAGTGTSQPQVDPNDPRNKPEYKKWFKLLDMHIPKEHLVLKMQAEGIDPSILDYVSPIQSSGAGAGAGAGAGTSQPQVDPNDPRNKPEYKKWFKLLDMHIPKEHLVLKMQAEGVDPSILDYVSPIQSSGAGAVTAKKEEDDIWAPRKEKKKEEKKEEKKPKSVRRRSKQECEQKMKNIYWDPIDDDKIDASAWKNMKYNDITPIDYKLLTNQFKAKETAVVVTKEEANDSVKNQSELVQLVTDEKRLRNVGMSLARLKYSYSDIKQGIIRMDDVILDSDMVRMLKENSPTDEEIALVKDYDGKIDLLNEVDKFFKVLSDIPSLQMRIKCISIRQSLKDDLNDCRNDFDAFDAAMHKCCESVKFYKLLEVILMIGNYMNGTGFRGGYYGFQISYLPKLRDTKSVDNKSNLLNYIYDYLEKEEQSLPEAKKSKALITIIDDFSFLVSLKGKDYEQLKSEFSKLNADYELIGRQKNVPQCSSDDRFAIKMAEFATKMKTEIDSVKRSKDAVEQNYNQFLTKYACSHDYTISNIIDDLATFIDQLKEVRDDILKKRAIELEIKKKKEANEKMQQLLKEQKQKQLQGQNNDLLGQYTTMKNNQMMMKLPHVAKDKIETLGTLKNRKSLRLDFKEDKANTIVASPYKPLSHRTSLLDDYIPESTPIVKKTSSRRRALQKRKSAVMSKEVMAEVFSFSDSASMSDAYSPEKDGHESDKKRDSVERYSYNHPIQLALPRIPVMRQLPRKSLERK